MPKKRKPKMSVILPAHRDQIRQLRNYGIPWKDIAEVLEYKWSTLDAMRSFYFRRKLWVRDSDGNIQWADKPTCMT